MKNNSLYLVLSREYNKEKNILEIAEKAILGGVDIIQMREKDLLREDLIDLGNILSIICVGSGVTFIVNDDPTLAAEVNADGVHLGQEDIKKWSVDKVRDLLGKNKIIGVSTHSPEQFKHADSMDVDYIAFGPIFDTETKDYSIGTESIPQVLAATSKPVVFIGGITPDNVSEILEKGGKNIAVIRAIMRADDAERAAREIKDRMV
ncbi:MAG: thiamine phosphate synthase [Candidatus Omnitrophota bacterium]